MALTGGEPAMTVDQREYPLVVPRRDALTMTLYRLGMAVLYVAYLSALGAWTLRPMPALVLTVLAGLGAVLALVATWRTGYGPQAALTPDGIRMRTSVLGGLE